MLTQRRRLVVVALGLAVYLALTVLVITGSVDGFDHRMLRVVDRHQVRWASDLAKVLSAALSPPVDMAVFVVGSLVLARRDRSPRVLVVAAVVLATLAGAVLGTKYGVARPLPHSPWWAGGQGFPSGHTAAVLVCLGTLALLIGARRPPLRRPLLVATATLTVVVAVALVYARYHWVTDVVASIALGIAVLTALSLVELRPVRQDEWSNPKV